VIDLTDLALYQRRPCSKFSEYAAPDTSVILEIGSDRQCQVLRHLASKLSCLAVGVDMSPNFARDVDDEQLIAIEAVGERLPLSDNSIDGIISIATLEHVNDLPGLLAEVKRVLRPGGIFYTDYGPIWTGPVGHHVFAQIENKEARFWKEGHNPIPDYFHLILDKEEMRKFLLGGPCDDRLVGPIVDWIYERNLINRLYFEDYVRDFEESGLEIDFIEGRERHLNQKPSAQLLKTLHAKHGKRNFTASYIDVLCRKPGTWSAKNFQGSSKYQLGEKILRCPKTGGELIFSAKKNGYISESAGLLYKIDRGVPVLKPEKAEKIQG